jgi:hypothetical protein
MKTLWDKFISVLTEDIQAQLRDLDTKGCTDSDIRDFCDEHNISYRTAFDFLSEINVPDCCKGCKSESLQYM